MHLRFFLACLMLMPSFFAARAQTIRGEVLDANDGSPVSDVSVHNIYNDANFTTNADGGFLIAAAKGELLEFRKLGYKITRVRIPQGMVPQYFRIIIQKGPIELPEVNVAGKSKDYKSDSLKFREIYKRELELPTLSTLDAIQHPFTALSKHNREIWAFQKEYDHFQKEKYIDYTFNEKLVKQLTGLEGDQLQRYMQHYRPSYEQLRSMSEYSFYNYIKETARRFRLANSTQRTSQ